MHTFKPYNEEIKIIKINKVWYPCLYTIRNECFNRGIGWKKFNENKIKVISNLKSDWTCKILKEIKEEYSIPVAMGMLMNKYNNNMWTDGSVSTQFQRHKL